MKPPINREYCGRKVRFHSEREARWMLRHMLHLDEVETLEAYSCNECEGWHLGHPSRKQVTRRSASRKLRAERQAFLKKCWEYRYT